MEALFIFLFKNRGEAEVFEETAKTYPSIAKYSILAIRDCDDGMHAEVIVHVYQNEYEHIMEVLNALSSMHEKGPATGRYEWK